MHQCLFNGVEHVEKVGRIHAHRVDQFKIVQLERRFAHQLSSDFFYIRGLRWLILRQHGSSILDK